MAAGGTTYVKTQRMRGFIALFTSAACEWFLIFLLLVDALLSYLLTKFASYCELQAPCILCSRLDRVFGGENPELYQTLLCSNHRSEISSLISCHIHNKVADGHGMCDDCLLSFTTKTKASPKTHRLLVGKLGLVPGDCSFQSSLRRDLFAGSLGSKPCTCCGKFWKPGYSAQRLFQLQSPRSATSNLCIPSPHASRQSHLNNCHNSKFCGSSYFGFTELKLFSDSEHEFPFSDDDDDVASLICENNEAGSDPMRQCRSIISPKFLPSDSNLAEPNSSYPHPMTSLLDPCMGPNISKQPDVKLLGSDSLNDYGLGEINWQQVNQKSSSSDQPKLISLHELMTVDGTHSFVGASPEKSVDISQASDNGLQSVQNHEEGLKKFSTRAGAFKETDLTLNEKQTEEQVGRVKEELKLLPSQNSSPRGSNMSLVFPLSDDASLPETLADAFRSNGTQVLQKSVSVDSGLGSFAGSNVSEIEGQSLVDQLKRQIAYDKKCMSSLYKELEEERNASAIATNQALAMITRLQEEKAALHMESLQYLRMMEEQAEHDAHALDKADDLLSEKEKEIQDLEAELEFYRLNLADEPVFENMHEESSYLKAESMTVQNASVPHITNNLNTSCNSKITVVSKSSDETVAAETPTLEFEEEKLYFSQWLKNLEKKLHQISCNETSSNMPDGRLEKLEDSKSDGFSNGGGPQLNGQTEETDMSVQKKFNISNGSVADQDGSVSSDSDDCSLRKENNHYTSVGPKNPMHKREVDLVALENEILELNDKLEALKADHDLLECILKSLQNRNNMQFVQEIACQLHELRKIGIRSRWCI